MNRYIWMALLLLLGPASLRAQSPEDARARIAAAKERAADAGVPVSLLENRVAEGRAKGVPLARIAAVVERRAATLVRARTVMSPAEALTAADLSVGADALEAGIDGRTLRALIERTRAEDRPVAIAVLSYLHREEGLPVGEALTRVTEALERGPEALRSLPAQAAAARGRRGPPAGVGRGQGVGRGAGGGPPEGLPAPGRPPGAGKPDDPGKPGGKPGGGPPGGAGRPGGGS